MKAGQQDATLYFIEESLRQNLFWLRIMAEHAFFIRLGLPCEEIALRLEAEKLQSEFEKQLKEAKLIAQNPTKKKVRELNKESINLITAIIDFKSRVLKLIICCKITTGFNFPLLIDHIRREAIYFRAALIKLQDNIPVNPVEELLQEELFWLRIMADHSKFIAHLLDPSERKFISDAENLSIMLDQLRLHTTDFESMLVPQTFEISLLDNTTLTQMRPGVFGTGLPEPYSIGSLERFTNEAIEAIIEIRDFKVAAKDLINNCKILSIIPPLLADHVVREAQRALQDVKMAFRNLPAPCKNIQVDELRTATTIKISKDENINK